MRDDSFLIIVQLCTLDSGGAGKAALRLNSGLRNMGVDSTMIVALKQSSDPAVTVLGPGTCGELCEATVEYDKILSTLTGHWGMLASGHPERPQGLDMFSDTKAFFRLECVEKIQGADIVNFHWMAGFFDYSNALSSLKGKRIVWTLHDMNPFTGGCHYSGGCEKYKYNCGACPQLGTIHENDLSRQVWEQKRKAYKDLDITVVTPSRWMAECASASSLFKGFPVMAIPNSVPTDIFRPIAATTIRKSLDIPENAKVILFGADHLMDRRKGFALLLDALNSFRPKFTESPIVIAVFGKPEPGLTISSKYQVLNFGSLSNEEQLASLYSIADVLVLPSLEDNLPNTVLEAMACGTPVVGFDTGGVPDMISHKVNGFLARPSDVASLAEGIDWCLFECDRDSIANICRDWVLSRYTPQIQSAAYLNVYKKLADGDRYNEQSVQLRNNRIITVATSIAPKDIEKQQAAIATWLHLGLRVLSLNNSDEINLLNPYFPDVRFVSAVRNAQEVVGKPLVYFDDILAALENSGAEFCGIINSDIHLKADEHFPDFIVQESRNSFIYGSRIDIASLDDTFGTELGTGFDFFFFDRAVIDLYPRTNFSIGATWWDYWAVIVPLLKSYAVKRLVSPVAFHVDHAKNWSPSQWHNLGGLFSSYLSELGFTFSTANLHSSVYMFLDYVDYVSQKLVYGPSEANCPASGTYLVSAIVSTYNAEKFFRGCLQDLLDQTLYKEGKLEIIIINSGSQQNEGAIAREFISHFPQHVVYLRTERETLYEAWNRGISLAHGTYLTHANTGDRHRSDAFEVMARELDQNNVGLVYADAMITRQANETFEQNSAFQKWLHTDFNLREALLDCPFGYQVMWRASAHVDLGMFDGNFKRADDYEFFLRLALHQGALHLPKILTLYYESMSNISYESQEDVFVEVTGFIGKVRRETPLDLIYPFLSQDRSGDAKMDFASHLHAVEEASPVPKSVGEYQFQTENGVDAMVGELNKTEYLFSVNPSDKDIFMQLIALYNLQGRYDEAFEAFKKHKSSTVNIDNTPLITEEEIATIEWFHRIDLGNGIVTPGRDDSNFKLQHIGLPENLEGRTVLDIGAWDGFFSFTAERRGAAKVVSADIGIQPGYKVAKKILNSQAVPIEIDVMDLAPDNVGTFDLVLCLGVLYHLKHPLMALERIYSVTKDQLILETHVDMLECDRPAMAFYPGSELNGDASNWCGPNPAMVIALLKTVGFSRAIMHTNTINGGYATNRAVFHAWS